MIFDRFIFVEVDISNFIFFFHLVLKTQRTGQMFFKHNCERHYYLFIYQGSKF